MKLPHSFSLKQIRHVLLDMDGTLLDRYFDDYFWQHLLPEKYAEKNNLTFGAAKRTLFRKYRKHEETLNWTDIDFWSREVDIDIPALKEQIKHLIEVHPHVEDFLRFLKRKRKKVFLVTNAHYKVLDIKMKKTLLGQYLDSAVTSFEIGYPKEHMEFWIKLQKKIGFHKDKTIFIDDTEAVLKTARNFGIKYVFLKIRANSRARREIRKKYEFPVITDYDKFLEMISSDLSGCESPPNSVK